MSTESRKVEYGILQREVLSEKIVQRLLSMIREKRLRPGDKLPPERELAALMNVSRPSLREALRALSLMGIIEHRQGSGTRVASLEPSRLVEHIDLIFSLEDSTLLDLFQARKILEVGLAGLSAEKITDEELDQIDKVLQEGEQNINDPAAFSSCDIKFHGLIARSSGNRILMTFMESVAQLNLYSRRRTGEHADVREHTRTAHRDILDALRKHSPEEARAAMMRHLSFVEERLKTIAIQEETRTLS